MMINFPSAVDLMSTKCCRCNHRTTTGTAYPNICKSFSTINSDIQRFRNWFIENNYYHICMESTGKY